MGLDIGTTHVRGAEVSYGSGGPTSTGSLGSFASVELPHGAVRDGEVVEVEVVASALRTLWSRGKFSTKDVVIGIGNQRVIVRDLEVAAMPLGQLRKSLGFQAADILPMAADDALMDYYPIAQGEGQNGPVLNGLFVAAVRESVEQNISAVIRAGLNPVQVDLNAFALLRALHHGERVNRTVAYVDVGARITDIVIAQAGVPHFVRMLPAGGQDITDAIGSVMKLNGGQAEQLKREIGVGFAVAPGLEPAADAATTVARSLIENVRNTVAFYTQSNPQKPVELLVLSGGGVLLQGLGQALATATRLQVTLGRAVDNLKVSRGPAAAIAEVGEQDVTIAVGLATAVAA